MFAVDNCVGLRRLGAAILVAACTNLSAQASSKAQKRNMELAGYHDPQERSAYQPLDRLHQPAWRQRAQGA